MAQPVMLVEDDNELRMATAQMLELAGHDVLSFANAESALSQLSPEFAGMIVSDIRMPRMDGLELLTRVRALDPAIPVVLVTGHGDVPMAVKALHDGAADFLTKPSPPTTSPQRSAGHRTTARSCSKTAGCVRWQGRSTAKTR